MPSTVRYYACNGPTNQTEIVGLTNEWGACDTGTGSWRTVQVYSESEINALIEAQMPTVTLSMEELASLITAALLVIGVAWGVRTLVAFTRGRK